MDDRHTSDESNAAGHAHTAPDAGARTGHLRLGPWPFDADDGFCADLDAPAGERGIVVRAGWHMSGMGTSGPGAASSGPPAGSPEANRTIPGTVARAISDAVDGERARAAQADITIRTELDPHASGLPASQVGAILSGLLARAVDACLGAAARGDAPLDGDEIVVVARLDAGWLLLHVIDGAAAPAGCVTDTMGLGASAPGASDGGSILSNATSTARSIGGTLELRNVPFGPGTLATARIPLAALAAAG
jgi:hypothetical protein